MALKKKLGGKSSSKKSSEKSIRSKFKKRDKSVLEKTYNDREERSKSGSGKSAFDQEVLGEYGVKEFKPHAGDNYFEIMPVSYKSDVPYQLECQFHYSVGIANDTFVCVNRYLGKKCYRCDEQQKKFKTHVKGTKLAEETKALFPTDREIYLIWDRTEEIAENKEPVYELSIWAAPKTKVHAEIQILTRDKKAKTTLDISDVEEDGEGRTVSFEMHKKDKDSFPEYKGFSLIEREDPIPDEILELLGEIIEAGDNSDYKHPLEMFLHIPEYNEVKESMQTEDDVEEGEEGEEEEEEKPKGKKDKKKLGKKDKKKKDEPDEEEVLEKLEELKEELEEMNKFSFKKWCKNHDYEDALEMDRDEAIEAIVDDLYSKVLDGELDMDDIS